MCKRIPGSGVKKIILYTVSAPYKKGNPGFVARQLEDDDHSKVRFTEDLWMARTWSDRKELDRVFESIKRHAGRKGLFTHEAIASLSVPEVK